MKGLSVRQPWASLIAEGLKTIELRTWRTHYRGRLLICASQTANRTACKEWGIDDVRGVTMCSVKLIDVRREQPGDEDAACAKPAGRWCWVLTDPRPVRRRRILGQLGLFTV